MEDITEQSNQFWARVARNGDCWEWTGYRMTTGYGRTPFNGRQEYTHRIAYELTNGPIPKGMHVCHTCDNPPCCNPAHLWLGTMSENMNDRHAKGRSAVHRPEITHTAKLNWNTVRLIRSMWPSGKHTKKELAVLFHVSEPTIRDVIIYRTWKH